MHAPPQDFPALQLVILLLWLGTYALSAYILMGMASYACVKRKGFRRPVLLVIVCLLCWPVLILLELLRSPNGVESSRRPIEYVGMGLAAVNILLPVLMYLSRL
ncbi:hypothetical protein E3E11_06525 [Oecophyllibacter saccharovorans]|uniref:hypothetical protein n=1 Tax=Oecophyllibacter saccharovorans TaxID=2558360 RepID=UPI0011451B78|nr:hypothetical protein [Oecophyllibacter saccharovorans]QDH15559.1 hypothetical protein E3E11_06525 [Oecophyllibacter saccharovorans]